MNTIETHIDYLRGIASNIPECCVRFFVQQVIDGNLTHINYDTNEARGIHKDIEELRDGVIYTTRDVPVGHPMKKCEYVACDDCFAKIMAGTLQPNETCRCVYD